MLQWLLPGLPFDCLSYAVALLVVELLSVSIRQHPAHVIISRCDIALGFVVKLCQDAKGI